MSSENHWILKNLVKAVVFVTVVVVVSNVFLKIVTRHNRSVQVPDMAEMTIAQADSAARANGMKVEQGNSAIQNKLLTGEYMAAMILEENILKIQETKKEPLKVVYPKEGCILISSPICIMKSTKNPEGAKAAVDWWLSKEGQQAVTKGWMHSVRPDVAPPNGAPKLESLLPNAIKVDWNKMATKEAEIKNEFRTRVMDKK